MAGICGTDVHLWKGQLPIPRPIILGHETVGLIARLGEGVERDWTGAPLAEGDRVTWSAGPLRAVLQLLRAAAADTMPQPQCLRDQFRKR